MYICLEFLIVFVHQELFDWEIILFFFILIKTSYVSFEETFSQP